MSKTLFAEKANLETLPCANCLCKIDKSPEICQVDEKEESPYITRKLIRSVTGDEVVLLVECYDFRLKAKNR